MKTEHTSDLAAILIKPDAHIDGVFSNLVNDICSVGFTVFFQQDLFLAEADVVALYPKETLNQVGRIALVTYLANQRVTFIVLKSHFYSGQELFDHLHQIKGNKEERTGLRHKYNTVTVSKEDKIKKSSRYYRWLMVNNLHVFDSWEHIHEFAKRHQINWQGKI